MRRGILKSFFSSGLQAIAVQVLGVLFIVVVAKVLPKEEFGIIQWANATAMFITTLLSFGMEQVVVRRIASSSSSDWAASAFLFHNFIGSLLAFCLTLLAAYLLPDPRGAILYLPLFFAAQAIIFLVTPLKQFLNAKHLFTPYGIIAVFSNGCKIILAVILVKQDNFNIITTGNVLVACALIELIALLIYVKTKTSFRLRFRFSAYKKLIKESMPQYMAVVFDSSLSRLDIILLGIIGGSYAAMGEYGFAYRAYEIARLPIVIIAPVILNVFARLLSSADGITTDVQQQIKKLYTVEIFIAVLIPLTLNILWSPLLDYFLDNKYGSANATVFLLLSVCVPLHFFVNLMWTMSFAAKKYKKIASLTMFSAVLNLVLNIALIPFWGGVGAAVAYLITTIFQTLAYYLLVNKHMMHMPLYTLFRFLAVAAIAYLIVIFIPIHVGFQLILAVMIYVSLNFVTRWIDFEHFRNLKTYLEK